MTDMQAQLDKIRSDAAECLVLSSLANSEKKEMFAKMAEHLSGLASEVEKRLAVDDAHVPFVEHRSPEFNTDLSPARSQPAVSNASATAYQATRSRRLLPWLLVIVAALIIGVLFRTNENAKKFLSLFAVQSKQEAPLLPQDDAKQVRLLSNDERERSLIAAQLGALAARVGSFEKALDNFKRVRGEGDSNGRSSGADETTAALTKDLATARRDLETKVALLNKASDEAAQFRKSAEATTAALQEERKKTVALTNDLATARRDLETKAALSSKAGDETAELRRTADATAAALREEHKKTAASLQQEREHAGRLEQALAAARRDLETQTALAAKATDDASRAKQAADDAAAGLRKSLQEEQERAGRLETDLAAARRDVETQTAMAAKATDDASQLKQAAEQGSAELKRSLQKEHERAEALRNDLSTAHTAIYAYEAQARKASDQAADSQQASENGTAALRKSLQQEQERAGRLEQDLAAARRDVETQAVLATKANDDTARSKRTAEHDSAELQRSLQKEHERAEELAQNLSMVQTAIYAYGVQERMASGQAAQSQQATDNGAAELRKLLQQEREKTTRLERELASERQTTGQVAQSRQPGADAIRPVAAPQTATAATRSSAEPDPEDAAETARLVARASLLLGQGDVGSARVVLERAAETGNAQASFALAETYDPLILRKWGAYGTLGDAAKARDLYARAQAGGIKEAKERFDALRR